MDWHTLSREDTLSKLDSGSEGLSGKEARERLERDGPNTIEIKKPVSPLHIFINQFKNLLVILLLFAAFISLGVGLLEPEKADFIDAFLIFAIVIANALFGFFQEYKAEKSIEALARMAAPRATVLRDGEEVEIDSEEVVAGDILVLREGDQVAADARLIEAFSMFSDESSLTGESVPTLKKTGKLPENLPLAERSNMVFMNAVITRGRGLAVVVRTGLGTEVGKIAKEIAEAPEKVTQFQIEIEDIGKKVAIITLCILVIIAATELIIHKGDIFFVFIAAVALGVAAIPEGLPAVVTLSLSIATNRMLKQKALMRRLSTIQDLGSVDVICTDKTGTLTENIMTVTSLYIDGETFTVTGKGHEKDGLFLPLEGSSLKDMTALLNCALLCNDAQETKEGFKGDPTEIAVLMPAYKAGIDVRATREGFKRVGEVSFSPDRKLMSTANSDGKKTYAYVKGAPEVLVSRCDRIVEGGRIRKLTSKDRQHILEQDKNMASEALRILGFAYKESPPSMDEEGMENGLVFLGLMGMIDPPREGVKEAVEDCRKAGIRVIMITGDNRYTAEAIGRELGFAGKSLTGDELDGMTHAQFGKAVEKVDIYARTSPKHKVLLLRALKENGHIVCMTGDGVNDAAAIKNSDVGIAMGIRGTEVTKQASDIIVLDDNFITIRNSISEGRGTFDNIRKFVAYLLGANIAEVLIIFLASITGLGISAKIAVQLLWINLVTDGLPALALGVDPSAKDIMSRKPRKKGSRMISGSTLYFMLSIGIGASIAILALYAYMLSLDDTLKAQTVLFTAFVFLEMLTVYIVRWRYRTKAIANRWLHISVMLSVVLQLAVIYGPVASLFGAVPLAFEDVGGIAAALALYSVLVGIALQLERFILPKSSGEG